ncbi:hypothetical protein HaLaN_14228, partial [Haematococcus lacustris]
PSAFRLLPSRPHSQQTWTSLQLFSYQGPSPPGNSSSSSINSSSRRC